MKDFKELKVWNNAYALSLAVYEKSRSFPREEASFGGLRCQWAPILLKDVGEDLMESLYGSCR